MNTPLEFCIPVLLGLEGRKIHAGMALGMPAFRFPNYIDKKPVETTWL